MEERNEISQEELVNELDRRGYRNVTARLLVDWRSRGIIARLIFRAPVGVDLWVVESAAVGQMRRTLSVVRFGYYTCKGFMEIIQASIYLSGSWDMQFKLIAFASLLPNPWNVRFRAWRESAISSMIAQAKLGCLQNCFRES